MHIYKASCNDYKDKGEFNIIHLSDLHFADDINNKRKNIDAMVQRAIANHDRDIPYNVCVISGDITKQNKNITDDHTSSYIRKIVKQLTRPKADENSSESDDDCKPLKEGSIVIVPGNHDVEFIGGDKGRSTRGFQELMAKLGYESQDKTKQKDNDPVMSISTYNCKDFSVVICGFDSTLLAGSQSEPLDTVGYISDDQMKLFSRELKRLNIEQSIIVRIAVLHHHVLPMVDAKIDGDKKLTKVTFTADSQQFRNWLRIEGFSLVLHGHRHRSYLSEETQYVYTDPADFQTAPVRTLVYAGSPPANVSDKPDVGYHDISITKNTIKISGFKWDSEPSKPDYLRIFYHNKTISSITDELKKSVDKISSELESQQKGGRECKVFLSVDKLEPIDLAVLVLLEMMGAVEKDPGVEERFCFSWGRGDKTLMSFLSEISVRLKRDSKIEPFFTRYGTTDIVSPFKDSRSLLRTTKTLAEKRYQRERKEWSNLNDDQKEKLSENLKSYNLMALFAYDDDGCLKILLTRHSRWPMFLLPQLVREDLCILTQLKGLLFSASEPPPASFSSSCTNFRVKDKDFCCAGREVDSCTDVTCKKVGFRRGPFLSPSGGGISNYNYMIHICCCTKNISPDILKYIPPRTSTLLSWSYRWFSKKEIEDQKHGRMILKADFSKLFGSPDELKFADNRDLLMFLFDEVSIPLCHLDSRDS